MKLFRLLFQPETRAPVTALMFASGACVAMVLTRVIYMHSLSYAFLVWNLFLAWLPLIFSLLIRNRYTAGKRGWPLAGLVSAWLLFLPNAPYIFTDLIHLMRRFYAHFWMDLILILSCAVTGLMLGFISLYFMQALVAHRFGKVASWLFVAGVAALSGAGVFIGRFLRLNSWDVLLRPAQFYHRAEMLLANPFENFMPYAFIMLFGLFLFIGYMMFHALTQLPQNPALKSLE